MLQFFKHTLSRFAADKRGNVAMMFGLSMVPLMGVAGGAVDYAMASQLHARLQTALDTTALAVIHDVPKLTPAQVQAEAQARFNAVYQPIASAMPATLTATVTGATLVLNAKTGIKTSFLGVVGVSSLPIAASASSTYNDNQIEIALVLDNTGSMADNNKMVELKKAVNNFIDKLEAQSAKPGAIKVSIVPFNTEVQIGTSYKTASWLRYGVKLENPLLRGPISTPANWTGCVTDRDQPYDTLDVPPTGGQSNYVASPCHYPGLSPMTGLTSDLESVRATAKSMQPTGATNITVGFTMGLSTLRSDTPFGASSSNATNVTKFVVLLTDGNNTQNRWGGNGWDNNPYAYEIDKRLSAACQTARSSVPAHVYTVRVMDGNASLLRSCATDAASYFDVQNAVQLDPVFQLILNSINHIRLSS